MTRKTTVVDDVMNDDDDEQDIPTFESVNDNGSVTPTAAAEVVDDEEVVEVLSNAPVWQFEDPQFEAGDMAMPRIKLAQMQTPEVVERKAMPGQWIVRNYDPVDELIFVPQAVAKTRELRNDEGKLLASSPDGIRCCLGGGRKCATCPNAQWDRSDPDNLKPPKCQEVWQYIVVDATHDALAQMSLTKTAVPAAGFINLQMKMKGPGKFALAATSSQEKGKGPRGGYYYVPKFTVYQMEPEELARYRRMAVPDKVELPAPPPTVSIAETAGV